MGEIIRVAVGYLEGGADEHQEHAQNGEQPLTGAGPGAARPRF
jgi:hypothetical protein